MSRYKYRSGWMVLLTVALLLGITTPQAAFAAESIPPLAWTPPVSVAIPANPVTSPTGNITVPCNWNGGGKDLRTYSSTGQLVQSVSRTSIIDGVQNCITRPVVDNAGSVYGRPYGKNSSGVAVYGPNLLAYSGNTMKWKYPTCSREPAVGADGNIYLLKSEADGTHLIGLAPNLAAGQSQPTKVRDFKISGNCDLQIRPYKDGVTLTYATWDDRPHYYSYGGKYLGQATIGHWGADVLNAEGKLFNPTFTWSGGQRTSAGVSMYDPQKGAVKWTTQVSTPGANVQGVTLSSIRNGGLVASLLERKMLANGIPAIPPEWVYTIVTLDRSGHEVRRLVLPNQDAQGVYLQGGAWVSASDDEGRIAILRNMSVQTGLGSPATASAISVDVYNAVDGTWFYQNVMSGDMTKPGGPNGYGLVGYAAMTNNTLAFVVQCDGNCSDYGPKLYAIQVSGLGMDYPRGDILGRTARAPAPFIALGDSFSSGEGVPPFEAATTVPDVNTCHRSTAAYPRLIAGSSSKIPSLGTNGFRACSGAVTTNVIDVEQWNESIQLDWWPDSTTQLVTVTIGGNDIGFSDFGKACVFPTQSCDFGTAAYNNAINKIDNELPAKLEETYKRILAYAPNAKVFVLGYPQVVADKSVNDPGDSRCFYMQGGGSNWSEARAARDVVTKLNNKISATVANVKGMSPENARMTYVSMTEIGSPFIGREICGTESTSWFQNIDQATGDPAYVFHPNNLGQEGYAVVAGAAINAQ